MLGKLAILAIVIIALLYLESPDKTSDVNHEYRIHYEWHTIQPNAVDSYTIQPKTTIKIVSNRRILVNFADQYENNVYQCYDYTCRYHAGDSKTTVKIHAKEATLYQVFLNHSDD